MLVDLLIDLMKTKKIDFFEAIFLLNENIDNDDISEILIQLEDFLSSKFELK